MLVLYPVKSKGCVHLMDSWCQRQSLVLRSVIHPVLIWNVVFIYRRVCVFQVSKSLVKGITVQPHRIGQGFTEHIVFQQIRHTDLHLFKWVWKLVSGCDKGAGLDTVGRIKPWGLGMHHGTAPLIVRKKFVTNCIQVAEPGKPVERVTGCAVPWVRNGYGRLQHLFWSSIRIILIQIVVTRKLHLTETFHSMKILMHELPLQRSVQIPQTGICAMPFQRLIVLGAELVCKAHIVTVICLRKDIAVIVGQSQFRMQKWLWFEMIIRSNGRHLHQLRRREQDYWLVIALRHTILGCNPSKHPTVDRTALQSVCTLMAAHIRKSDLVQLGGIVYRILIYLISDTRHYRIFLTIQNPVRRECCRIHIGIQCAVFGISQWS